MINPTFWNMNKLFLQLSNVNANDNDDFPKRNYFDKCYIPLVTIKYFNVLISNKPFLEQPIKNK